MPLILLAGWFTHETHTVILLQLPQCISLSMNVFFYWNYSPLFRAALQWILFTTTNYFFLIFLCIRSVMKILKEEIIYTSLSLYPLSLSLIFIISHIEITIYYLAEAFALYLFFSASQYMLASISLLCCCCVELDREIWPEKGGGLFVSSWVFSLFVDCSTTTAAFPSPSEQQWKRDDVGRVVAKVGRL